MSEKARFYLAFLATLLSIAALVFFDFPERMVTAFGFGHDDPAHTPMLRSLWSGITGDTFFWSHQTSGFVEFMIGCILIAGAPISAAVLVLLAPNEGQARTSSLVVTLVAYVAYMSYYIGTYHAPLLVLSVLAWYLATQHVKEITSVNLLVERSRKISEANKSNLDRIDKTVENLRQTLNNLELQTTAQKQTLGHIDEVVGTSQTLATTNTTLLEVLEGHVKDLQDTAGALRHTSIRGFYDTFGPKVESAKKTIVSVERRWTWEKSSWARIREEHCNSDARSLEFTIDSIKNCALHRALVATGASRCLYIGPWPIREPDTGYEKEAFGQLLALIHTMCVCEVAKYTRAEIPSKGPIRLHVAVADVPTWVKIVDSDYWLLQGESLQPLQTTYCYKPTGDQLARRHASRLAAQWDIVETYNRNARRGHEHVLALILEHATTLNQGDLTQASGVDKLVRHDLDRIVRSIKGGAQADNPFDDYLIYRGNVAMKSKHIVHLFRLFLALHFLKDNDQLTGEHLSNSLASLRYSDIWNRIA